MVNVGPMIAVKPENWNAQVSGPFAFQLPLENDGTRVMKTGIRFHAAEISLLVPAHWGNERAYACMNEFKYVISRGRQ